MLRILCPHCGVRDQTEFQFGSESNIERPRQPHQVSDADWADYLFNRTNKKGLQQELWVHTFGCRQWFHVVRNTVTHEIVESFAICESPAGSALPTGDSEK